MVYLTRIRNSNMYFQLIFFFHCVFSSNQEATNFEKENPDVSVGKANFHFLSDQNYMFKDIEDFINGLLIGDPFANVRNVPSFISSKYDDDKLVSNLIVIKILLLEIFDEDKHESLDNTYYEILKGKLNSIIKFKNISMGRPVLSFPDMNIIVKSMKNMKDKITQEIIGNDPEHEIINLNSIRFDSNLSENVLIIPLTVLNNLSSKISTFIGYLFIQKSKDLTIDHNLKKNMETLQQDFLYFLDKLLQEKYENCVVKMPSGFIQPSDEKLEKLKTLMCSIFKTPNQSKQKRVRNFIQLKQVLQSILKQKHVKLGGLYFINIEKSNFNVKCSEISGKFSKNKEDINKFYLLEKNLKENVDVPFLVIPMRLEQVTKKSNLFFLVAL